MSSTTQMSIWILGLGLAFVIGSLSSRLMKLIKLPNVTGYLIAGIIFGPYVLGPLFFGYIPFTNEALTTGATEFINLVTTPISWITSVALGFIAFTIGSSFKLSTLKQVGPRIMIITVLEALGGAAVVIAGLFIASIFIEIPTEIILTLGAIACATAPAATLMVVKQYKAHGPVVSTLLPVVALDDAVALIAFAILFSISKAMASGTNPNVLDLLVWPVVSILVSLIVGTALGFLVVLACKFFKSRANRVILCMASIFICVAFSMFPYTDWIGIDLQFSSLLAIMMVGAILINFRPDADRIFERMDMVTPPIFMLFFILSGAELDITIFWSAGALTIVVIALVYIFSRSFGKWGGAYLGARFTHSEKTVRKYLGFALLPQAGVAIGLATSASSQLLATGDALMQKYGSMILPIVLSATIVYELAGPVITKVALTKAGEIDKSEFEKTTGNTPTASK